VNLRRPATLVLVLAVLAGCGGADHKPATSSKAPATATAETASPATPKRWTTGYPNSIAVLGHSGSTGESSDPEKAPHVETRENSWATGTNPAVDSVYSRILARNPAIEGHVLSLSEGGADIAQVSRQAESLLERGGADLILVQVMDNDITCPLEQDALTEFSGRLTTMLEDLATGAPGSRTFLVSQFGSPLTNARTVPQAERAQQAGTGPCDFITRSGGIAAAKVARLEKAIHAYERALEDACRRVLNCTYDGGAFGRTKDRREYTSSIDPDHFSVKGHAKAAAVAWAALRRAHLVPLRP